MKSSETKRRRRFNAVFNAVMTALCALPAMILIQKMLLGGLAPWHGVLYMLPCLAVYPLGIYLHEKKLAPQFALTAGAAAAVVTSLAVILPNLAMTFEAVFLMVAMPIAAFALFTVPYMSGFNLLKPQIFVGGLIVYIVCAAMGGAHADSYAAVINIGGPVFLIAGLYIFNRESLRTATSPSGGKTRFPVGMRRNNMLILTIFIIIALVVANIERVRYAAGVLVAWVVSGVLLLINKMGDMLGYAEDMSGNAGMGGGDSGLSGLLEGNEGESPFWVRFWEIFSVVLIVAIVLLLVYVLYRIIKKLLVKFPDFFSRLFGRIKPEAEEFVDITESLDRDKFRSKAGGRFREVFERLRRQPKFDDMNTPRAKVRFAYRAALKKMDKAQRAATPNEFLPALGELAPTDAERFVDAYNKARYSNADIGESEVGAAKSIVDRV